MPGIPVTLKAELVRFWIGGQPGQLNKIHYPLVKKKKKKDLGTQSSVSIYPAHTRPQCVSILNLKTKFNNI